MLQDGHQGGQQDRSNTSNGDQQSDSGRQSNMKDE